MYVGLTWALNLHQFNFLGFGVTPAFIVVIKACPTLGFPSPSGDKESTQAVVCDWAHLPHEGTALPRHRRSKQLLPWPLGRGGGVDISRGHGTAHGEGTLRRRMRCDISASSWSWNLNTHQIIH